MKFGKNKIDKEILKYYINKSSNDDYDLEVFLNLFSYYSKITRTISEDEIEKTLKRYEDEVYSINNKKLGEKEKINIELRKIKEKGLYCNDKEKAIYCMDNINRIEKLLKNNKIVSEYNEYLKKELTKLQILLNMDITFYNAAYNFFVDKYYNIEEIYQNAKELSCNEKIKKNK